MFCYNCALDPTKYTFDPKNERFGLTLADCRLEMTFIDQSVAVEYISGDISYDFRLDWEPKTGLSHCKVLTSPTMINDFEIIEGNGGIWKNKCPMYAGMNPNGHVIFFFSVPFLYFFAKYRWIMHMFTHLCY
jgi:hypothetical protein